MIVAHSQNKIKLKDFWNSEMKKEIIWFTQSINQGSTLITLVSLSLSLNSYNYNSSTQIVFLQQWERNEGKEIKKKRRLRHSYTLNSCFPQYISHSMTSSLLKFLCYLSSILFTIHSSIHPFIILLLDPSLLLTPYLTSPYFLPTIRTYMLLNLANFILNSWRPFMSASSHPSTY